jgi:hypothetical protein
LDFKDLDFKDLDFSVVRDGDGRKICSELLGFERGAGFERN